VTAAGSADGSARGSASSGSAANVPRSTTAQSRPSIASFAIATKSKPRYTPGTNTKRLPTCEVIWATSERRRIGMIGFCRTRSRLSAAISTDASSVLGSCQLTTSSAPTPSVSRPAATSSASWR
jgi:hypothetical protein